MNFSVHVFEPDLPEGQQHRTFAVCERVEYACEAALGIARLTQGRTSYSVWSGDEILRIILAEEAAALTLSELKAECREKQRMIRFQAEGRKRADEFIKRTWDISEYLDKGKADDWLQILLNAEDWDAALVRGIEIGLKPLNDRADTLEAAR